jgi:hypothetical protein
VSKPLTFMQRSVIGWARNAATDHANGHPWDATCVALPEEKRAATRLERRGIVSIRRTKDLCGGYREWWVKLTPEGEKVAS